MGDKIIILTSKNYTHYLHAKSSKKIEVDDIYVNNCICKCIRHIPFISYFSLEKWKKRMDDFDTIIIFDSLLTKEALFSIVDLCKNKRFILFFRNKVTDRTRAWNFELLRQKGVEIWSYNMSDCDEFGFLYHPDPPDDIELEKHNTFSCFLYDMIFLGDNKGRETVINNVIDICEDHNLNPYMYVIHGKNIRNNQCQNNEFMSYSDYLNLLQHSRSILDIVNKDNWGVTYRPFESLFLRKKLITNYTDIVNYDFYNSQNIFIIGENDSSQLDRFLNSAYVDVSESILSKYRTANWLKGFNIR